MTRFDLVIKIISSITGMNFHGLVLKALSTDYGFSLYTEREDIMYEQETDNVLQMSRALGIDLDCEEITQEYLKVIKEMR